MGDSGINWPSDAQKESNPLCVCWVIQAGNPTGQDLDVPVALGAV